MRSLSPTNVIRLEERRVCALNVDQVLQLKDRLESYLLHAEEGGALFPLEKVLRELGVTEEWK
jgi:hypothetical protein